MTNEFVSKIVDKKLNVKETIITGRKLSQPFITIYEKTNIIGLRLQQLYNNSSTTLTDEELEDCKSIKDIVNKEYKLKKIPFKICRSLSNNLYEYVDLNELEDYMD